MVGLTGGVGFVMLGGLMGVLAGYLVGFGRGHHPHAAGPGRWFVVGSLAVFIYALVLVGIAAHSADNHLRTDRCRARQYQGLLRYVEAEVALDKEQTEAVEKFYVSRGPKARGRLVVALREISAKRLGLPAVAPCPGDPLGAIARLQEAVSDRQLPRTVEAYGVVSRGGADRPASDRPRPIHPRRAACGDPPRPRRAAARAEWTGRRRMRTPAEALAYAKQQHETGPLVWRGLCLKFVRTAYGLPGVYPSAASAWAHAQKRHHLNSGADAPRGVPVFWLGGSQGYGHVALSVGGGKVWTNDFGRSGGIDLASIDAITTKWGLNLVGWTEDLNEAVVWTSPTPTVDAIIEKARRVRRQTHQAAKDAAMTKIIETAKPYSALY